MAVARSGSRLESHADSGSTALTGQLTRDQLPSPNVARNASRIREVVPDFVKIANGWQPSRLFLLSR